MTHYTHFKATALILLLLTGIWIGWERFSTTLPTGGRQAKNTLSALSRQAKNTLPTRGRQAKNTLPTEGRQGGEKEAYGTYLAQHPYMTRPKYTKAQMKEMGIPKKDRPDLAYEHEFIKTINPTTKQIPELALHQAREEVSKRLKRTEKAAIAGVNWTERGPNNVAGRTRALMFDPNDATGKKVWAGGVAGGLWYNNDITTNTESWKKINDFWANMAVTAIAYDPSNTQIMYVGTGEGFADGHPSFVRGEGIWKTSNGGITWTKLSNTTPTNSTFFRYVNKIVVHSSGMVFAATRSGIIRSINGGATWAQIYNTACADIEIATNGDIYIGTFGGIVARTTNPTATQPTWTTFNPSTGGQRVELAIAPSESSTTISTTLYAIASTGGNVQWFRKSTNGGTSWTSVTIPKYMEQNCTFGTSDFTRGQAWYDLILKVRPNNPDVVLMGGIDVYGTTNGGTTWNLLSYWTGSCKPEVHADQHAIEFRPTNYDEAVFGNDGGVYYSANAGTPAPSGVTFSSRINDYNITQFYSCAMRNTPSSDVYLAGAQDNGTNLFTTADINSTTEVRGGDGGFCFIDQNNPNIAIASYTNNYFYRSTDGGLSFPNSNGLITETTGLFINPADYDNTANTLYLAGNSNQYKYVNNVDLTPNPAVTVSLSSFGQVSAINANCFTANRIFIGSTNGELFRIDNANSATNVVTNIGSALPAGYISCVAVGANDNELLVSFSNYDVNSLFYTNNGGTTWTNKDQATHGLPNIPVRWALFNPNDTKQVMLATELGVWSTSDITAANPGWEVTNNGLANVRCDMLKYRNSDKQVAIATYGRGLYTTNAFVIPEEIIPNFTASNASMVAYEPNSAIFTDVSTGIITSRNWSFGDGATPATATTPGPNSIRYSSFGSKTVTLTVNGNKTVSKKVGYLPTLGAKYTPAEGGNFETDLGHFVPLTNGGNVFWERGNSTVAGKNGVDEGANAFSTGITEAQYPNKAEMMLYTPNYNFSTVGSYKLSFAIKMNTEKNYDGMVVQYSTNSGNTWANLGNAMLPNWYNTLAFPNTLGLAEGTAMFSGILNDFTPMSFDCSSLGGNPQVAFRFLFKSDNSTQGIGIAIDNFQIVSSFTHNTFLPANNATSVSPLTNLAITFKTNISKNTSGNILIKRTSDNSLIQTIPISSSKVSILGQTATIDPEKYLPFNTQVYVEITENAFVNLLGSNYVGLLDKTQWQFTTGTLPPTANFNLPQKVAYRLFPVTITDDSIEPTAWNWSFGTGATPATATIVGPHNVTYNTLGVKTISLGINANTSTATQEIAILPTLPTNYTIDDGGNFETANQHFHAVGNGMLFERGNSAFTGKEGASSGLNAYVLGLTVAQYLNNTQSFLYTPNFNFATAGSYTLSFNTKFSTELNYDGFIVEYSVNNGSTWTQLGNSTNINWYNSVMSNIEKEGGFPAGTTFFSGVVSNFEAKTFDCSFLAGNANVAFRFVFQSDNIVQGKGVAIDDFQVLMPFRATTFSPANETTQVNPNTNLTITFNQAVQKGTTGNITIRKLSDDSAVETFDINSTRVAVSGSTVAINPTADLLFDANYYVEISSGYFKDLTDRNFAGFSGNTVWKFKTDISTGIEQNKLGDFITFYPNPITSVATLEVGKGLVLKQVQASVIDAKGAVISTQAFATLSETQFMDFSTLPAGKYLLHLRVGKDIVVKPFVKIK